MKLAALGGGAVYFAGLAGCASADAKTVAGGPA